MPNFPTLYSAYRNAQTPLSLRDFSRIGNFMTDSNQFAQGDNSTLGELVKKGSYWFDQGLDATGIPEWAGQRTGDLYDFFGADRAKGVELGRSNTRTAAEYGGAGLAVLFGLPEMAALAIPAVLGAANAYEKTDSGLSAATAAAMPYVGRYVGNFAASQAAKAFGWAEKDLAESAAKRVGTYIASQVGATAGLEGVNTAVSGQTPDVTSKEYWLGLAAQQIPFAAFDAKRIFTKPKFEAPTPEVKESLGAPKTEPTPEAPALLAPPEHSSHPEVLAEAQLRIEKSRQAALASVEPITNEVTKTEAITSINKSHDELAQGLGLQNKPESEAPEKLVGATQQTFPDERQAKAFADSLAKTHDTQVVFNPKTNSHRVYYRKKPVVEILPESPVVDVNAEPEKVIGAADAVGKKPDLVQEFLEASKTEADPARAAEIAANKVLSESAVVPTEEVKNRGGRPSKSKQVEELFFRLAGEEHADPRDAEFSKAMKDSGLVKEVQNNPNAVTESQANKGMRELALGYQAWRDGTKWRGVDMSKMSAKSAAEFIKIHVKASNKRAPTEGSKLLSVEDETAKQDEEFFDAIKAAEVELAEAEEAAVDLASSEKEIETAKTKEQKEKAEINSVLDKAVAQNEVRQSGTKSKNLVSLNEPENLSLIFQFGEALESSGQASRTMANIKWYSFRKEKQLTDFQVAALRKFLKVGEKENPGPALLEYWLTHDIHKEGIPDVLRPEQTIRGNDGSEIRIAGGGFVYSLQGYDAMTNKLGKHTLPKDGWITEAQLKVMGAKDRMLKNEEIELYKTIVPEAFKDGKVNIPALVKKLQPEQFLMENGKPLRLVHHTVDPEFQLHTFDTAKQTYTPELGKGVYLDAGSGWADHIEEVRGKPTYAIETGVKAGLKLFDGTIEEAQANYQNDPSYDGAIIRLRNGSIDEVHIRDPKNLIPFPSSELSRFNQGGAALSFGLGTKLEGLAPTFETMFYRLSRKAGIPDKEAAVMLPSFRKFVDAAGMKDVEFGELVRDSLVNGKDIKGMATTMGEKTRRMWLAGINADAGNASWARMMMTLLAHENGHLVDHLYNSGQMVSARARKAYENMLKWKNTASAEEISDTLKLSAEMLLPKEWQKLPEMQELLSAKDGTEALATLHGIFALSSHAKGFDAEIGMALLPAGPRGFFRTLAEYGRSFTRVLKNLWFFGGKTEKALQIRELQENFKQMQKGVQAASENLVKLQKLMSYDPSDYTQIKLSALEVLQNRSVSSDVKQIARFAAFDGEKKQEESQLLNAPKGIVGSLMRGASYLLEPLDSLTARVPKFAQVGNAILQTPATAKRYVGEFLEPLYGERDPVTKQVTAGSREQQEMVRLWNEDAGVNQAINLIEYKQNKNKKALDLTKPEGDVASALNALSPSKRNAVLAFVEKKKVATRVVQRRVLEAVDKVSALQLAEKIGSTRPDLYDQSEAIARNIKDAVELSKSEQVEDKLLAQSLMQEAQATVGNDRLFALYSSMAEKQLGASAKLKAFFADKDWFHSYVRVGSWAIDAWDKSGKQVYHTLPARTNAEAVALEKQLRADGLKTNIKKLTKGKFVKVDEEMQAMLENVDDRLKRSFMDEFSAQVDPVKLEEFFQKNSFASTLKHQVEVTERFDPTKAGRNLKGAKDLDVVAMELEQAGLMANTLAKMESGAKLSHAKADPKLKAPDMQHWMQQFDAAWEQYHIPDNELASKVSKAISVYSLGMNVGNMVAEGFQPMTTVMTEAIANGKGLGVLKLMKMMMGVFKDTAVYYAGGTKKKLAQGEEFNAWKDSGERKMLDTLAEEGALHNGSYTEAFNAEDQSMLSWKLKSRSGGSWLGSMTKKLGDYSMQMYQLFSRHNSRVTAVMGYRMAKAHGMEHEAAMDFTRRFLERAALTSTRAVRPVGMFAENTRALGLLASVMQRYNLGWLAMAARHIQRGWLLSDAKAAGRGFDQVSKSDARKATMYMLGSQLAAAGALGLPFVGALSKVYQQLTGKDLKADAYQMLSETLDEDAGESGFISDGLMRGFGNALLSKAGVPIDLGSRFAIGGLPGMSEYSGFDAGSVFGPTGGIIKTIATGVEAAAKDGDYMRAGKTLMPPGLRKLFDLAVNGDMTDNNSNRMGLTSLEKFFYGLGLPPDRIRKLRDFEQMSQNITANRRQSQDKVEAEIADLVRTNPAEAQAKLVSEAQRLGITPKELASGVAQRVVKATIPKDFRDTIPALDARQAISLMRGLGTDFGQPLETQKAQLQNATLSRLGVAPDLRSMMRAQMADSRLTAAPYLPMKVASSMRPSSRGLTAEQLAMLAGQ